MTIEEQKHWAEQDKLADEEREKLFKYLDKSERDRELDRELERELAQDEFKRQCEEDEREREEQKHWAELEKKLSEEEIKTFFKRMYEMKYEKDELGGTKKGDYVRNIVKYVTRFKYTHEKKNRIEDLKKARFCLDLLIDREVDRWKR